MTSVFDEAYANYLSSLAKLDTTVDIAEKNRLFRSLTEQLSALEARITKGETIMNDGDADLECDLL